MCSHIGNILKFVPCTTESFRKVETSRNSLFKIEPHSFQFTNLRKSLINFALSRRSIARRRLLKSAFVIPVIYIPTPPFMALTSTPVVHSVSDERAPDAFLSPVFSFRTRTRCLRTVVMEIIPRSLTRLTVPGTIGKQRRGQ